MLEYLKQNRTILKPKLKLQKLPKIFIKCVTILILNREQRSVLQSHDCTKDLADDFIAYFNGKISNIRKDLEKAPISTSQGYFQQVRRRGARFIYRSIRGWYQKNYSFITNKIMCPRPYIYVDAQEMWGWIDTCTHINSEYIPVMCRVSQGT